MSADRFNFLEFGEDVGAESSPAELFRAPVPREIYAETLSDGTALAEVRIVDPRGFRGGQEAGEEGAVTLSSLAGQAGQGPTKLRVTEVFGERGVKAGQFLYPTGLAVDTTGILFVADVQNHRVQRITPGGGVAVVGGRGVGRGQFASPQGIATDEEDSFFVVEEGNHRVQKFTREGVLTLLFGRQGRGAGELQGPTAIAVAPGSGDIFVADTGNSRVQRFDYQGRFLSVIGAPGDHYPSLSSPQALAVDAGGCLSVADTFAQRLLRYDPLGRLDRQIGGAAGRSPKMRGIAGNGTAPIVFHQPRALAADPSGLLYVADGGLPDALTGEMRGRIQCLTLPDGPCLAAVEKAGRGLGTLLRPGGLAVGPSTDAGSRGGLPRGDLYVADTLNHRILRFIWS